MVFPTPTEWLSDPEQVKHFEARLRAARVPRRRFMAIMAALGGAAALAACSGTPVATVASTVEPSTAASAAPSTAPSASASAAASTAPTAATSAASSAAVSGSARPVGSAAATPASSAATVTTPTAGRATPALFTWPTNITAPNDLATDQTFNQSLDNDPSDLDINKNLFGGGPSQIWQALLRYDPDFNLCAGDAMSYEVKNGGAQYIFKLNPVAAFSNGDPITAQTYMYSWTRQLDPVTAAAYAFFLFDIKNAESFNTKKGATAADLGLKAIDATTLEVTLERPAGYFPILAAYPAGMPAHKGSVDKFGDKWTEPSFTGAPIISNGPFVCTKWERGKVLTIERNEKYATGPKPPLKMVNFIIIPAVAGLAPYEGGQLDYRSFTGIPAGEIPRLNSDPALKQQLVRHSQSGLWYLVPEVDKAPFDGPNGVKVRQAIGRAIDRDQLAKVIQNLGESAYSLMAPDLPYFIDPAKYPEFKTALAFNPDAAKKLLDGTPFAGGKGFPKVTMSMRDEGATPRTAAEFIQKSLKDNLGMEIEFDIKPSSAFTEPMYGRKFQLIFLRWYMDYPDPANFYKDVFFSRKSSGKRQAWSDTAFDDLVLKAGAEPNVETRGKLYRDAEKMMLDQGVYSPLYYGFAYALFKPKIGGIPKTTAGIPQPNWNIFRDMQRTLYIKK